MKNYSGAILTLSIVFGFSLLAATCTHYINKDIDKGRAFRKMITYHITCENQIKGAYVDKVYANMRISNKRIQVYNEGSNYLTPDASYPSNDCFVEAIKVIKNEY